MRKILALFLLVAALASCQYKELEELEEDMVSLTILLDYSKLNWKPKVMRVVIYSLDRPYTSPYALDIKDSKTVTLPKGVYRIVSYNNDSEINQAVGGERKSDDLRLLTREADRRVITRNDSIDGISYYDYPDSAVTETVRNLILGSEQGDRTSQTVILRPQEVTSHVHVIIKNISSLSLLGSARISIDGIYRDYYIADNNEKPREKVNIIADGSLENEENEITADFNIFGIQNSGDHVMTLFLQGQGFSKFAKFNVTDQIERQRSQKDIYIEVDGKMDINDYVPKSPGFGIGINDWEENNLIINI